MPYKSKAQQAFFHTDSAKKSGISDKTVQEFDESSKGLKLPQHKDPKPSEATPDSKSHWRK